MTGQELGNDRSNYKGNHNNDAGHNSMLSISLSGLSGILKLFYFNFKLLIYIVCNHWQALLSS